MNGTSRSRGPVIFLPQDGSFMSFGVVKAPDAPADQLGVRGLLLPDRRSLRGMAPYSSFPAEPTRCCRWSPTTATWASTTVYAARLRAGQAGLTPFRRPRDGRPLPHAAVAGRPSSSARPAGSMTFDGVETVRVKLQITPARQGGARWSACSRRSLGLLGLAVHPAAAHLGPGARAGRAYGGRGRRALDRVSGGDPGSRIETVVRDVRRARSGEGGRAVTETCAL